MLQDQYNLFIDRVHKENLATYLSNDWYRNVHKFSGWRINEIVVMKLYNHLITEVSFFSPPFKEKDKIITHIHTDTTRGLLRPLIHTMQLICMVAQGGDEN